MRFRHIAAYRTKGIIAPNDEAVLFTNSGGYTARLTRTPDDIPSPADRAVAVASQSSTQAGPRPREHHFHEPA